MQDAQRQARHGSTARRARRIGAVAAVIAAALAAVLAGCASGPQRSGRDGAEANPPADLVQVPDAEPRVEPLRLGGPNKPYEVLGRSYVPITQDAPWTERGPASWYGTRFHGQRTASGEVYNMYAMTAAHPTLPIPSYARIRNPANGREVIVRINDRGPFHSNRIVDLSYTAALKLDLLRGVAPVELQRITFDEIRAGTWRRANDERLAARGAAPTEPVPAAGTAAVAVTATAAIATTATATAVAPAIVTTPAPVVVPAADIAMVGTAPISSAADAVTPSATSVEPVADGPSARAWTTPARGFWIQLGAFRAREGAENFHQRVAAEVEWLSPLLAVFNDTSMYRLQAGPYPSREEARSVAERVRQGLKLVPVIVERR